MNQLLKKRGKLLGIIAIFVMLLFAAYSCRMELDNSVYENAEKQKTIEKVRAWYEVHKPEEILLRFFEGGGQVPVKAEWSRAFTTEYDSLRVVETDIMSKGRLMVLDSACVAKYNETQDPKYKQCYTRMVFRINLNTKDTLGFLMTVVPDMDWLEISNFKPFMEVTYLFRSKQFGGQILFNNLDGSFCNGWRYKNGKIVATVTLLNAKPNQ